MNISAISKSDNFTSWTWNNNLYHKNVQKKESENNQNNTKNKILCGVAAGTAALATVYGVKKYNVKNIKNIQKTFQEVFMRNDITVEETRNILNRYKEIEKIKDRQEYAKALFEEAKKNYGLENTDIKLVFKDKKGCSGYCKRDNSEISITPNCSRKGMLDTVHHELRHAKQHAIIYNEYPEVAEEKLYKNFTILEFAENVLNKLNGSPSQSTGTTRENFSEYLKRNFPDFTPKTNIEKYKQYAEKLKDGYSNYVPSETDIIQYWRNFTEIDARKSGRAMSKYIKSKAFTPIDFIDDIIFKYFPWAVKSKKNKKII